MWAGRWRDGQRTARRVRGFAVQVQYMMAAGGELAAELHLEWMAGIIVNDDSHRAEWLNRY